MGTAVNTSNKLNTLSAEISNMAISARRERGPVLPGQTGKKTHLFINFSAPRFHQQGQMADEQHSTQKNNNNNMPQHGGFAENV